MFKRLGKMNPRMLIIIYKDQAFESFLKYCSQFLLEYDDSKLQTLNNISQLIRNLFFINQDTNVEIVINGKTEKGPDLDQYIYTIYSD